MKLLEVIRQGLEARDQATIDLTISILSRAKLVEMTESEVQTFAVLLRVRDQK